MFISSPNCTLQYLDQQLCTTLAQQWYRTHVIGLVYCILTRVNDPSTCQLHGLQSNLPDQLLLISAASAETQVLQARCIIK
jgi:hypothetical protein